MKPRMRSIAVFVGVGTATAALAVVATAFWFVVVHRQVVTASPDVAEAEFSELRARFADQRPLLDMRRRQACETPGVSQDAAPLHSFHTVIFDTRGGQRIVRIAVPYWFARRFAGCDGEFKWLGQLTFLDDTEFDAEAIRLSLGELDRRGASLVAYYQHPSGGQFISWVE